MAGSIELQIAAIDQLLGRLLPLLNQISSSAFFVQQGRMENARPVEEELNRWLAQNRSILPDSVTAPVGRLSARMTEWMMSMGTNATPHRFATDSQASFTEVERILKAYKASLAKELDSREAALRVTVAKSTPPPNPWVSGSFYLAVTVVLLTLLLVISTTVPWWAFPLVVLGGLIGVTVVGAFQLRHDSALSEEGFLSLMLATLRQLPLLRIAARKPTGSRPGTAKG